MQKKNNYIIIGIIAVAVIIVFGSIAWMNYNVNTSISNFNQSNNFDGTGVITPGVASEGVGGIAIPEYFYIDVKTDAGMEKLAINGTHIIHDGDTLYFNYTEKYVKFGDDEYRVVELVDSDGNFI